MPEENPSSPPPTAAAPETPAAEPEQPKSKFDIGEEFGTAKKNLPPPKIIGIGIVVIAIVTALLYLTHRPQSSATGTIDDIAFAEIPDQNSILVAVNVTVQNGSAKTFQIHAMAADLDTGETHHDDAASPVDFDRYYQALPSLQAHAIQPLVAETKIPPGGTAQGRIIVSFPVTAAVFNGRKSIKVRILGYDDPVPLVLEK